MLTVEGDPITVDLAVPEMPIGCDGEALYLVDCGPKGREGAHETVTILRMLIGQS